ncbi:hypothetical protein SAMN04515647_1683 [Cohaesibacter sp. ES.047]|nr:hypothetical protein SAMN04515647_1683 [Cohaesibacter sp. ES.047]
MGYFFIVIATVIGVTVVANSYVRYLAVIVKAEERLAISKEETERMKLALHTVQCDFRNTDPGTLP